MFLSNGGNYSKVPINRGTAIILENAVTSNKKKKILFTVWKQYGLKITLFGLQKRKKGTFINADMKLTTNLKKEEKK